MYRKVVSRSLSADADEGIGGNPPHASFATEGPSLSNEKIVNPCLVQHCCDRSEALRGEAMRGPSEEARDTIGAAGAARSPLIAPSSSVTRASRAATYAAPPGILEAEISNVHSWLAQQCSPSVPSTTYPRLTLRK